MSTTDSAASARVSVRQADECVVEDSEWASAPLDLLRHAQPWRTFRRYKGRQHPSDTYWAATVRDHVIYESRLEPARLLFADFAPDVRQVVAQPFLLKAVVEGRLRRHVPDYPLLTDDGPVLVDVKPRHRLERPKVAFACAWTRAAVASRGRRYEVWSEPDPHELENVRFLAGYRRDWLFEMASFCVRHRCLWRGAPSSPFSLSSSTNRNATSALNCSTDPAATDPSVQPTAGRRSCNTSRTVASRKSCVTASAPTSSPCQGEMS
ncbi:TnsA-like heteromeric transposase endonuclease subunit [Streptomyces sp. NPDC093586]|uniref:TnsA-like heteromeric transposase endonuclease subunit n=1 Tax=Streptomyces sp. NPDC093586 TaxID=3366042 RepID=UPI0037F5C2E9